MKREEKLGVIKKEIYQDWEEKNKQKCCETGRQMKRICCCSTCFPEEYYTSPPKYLTKHKQKKDKRKTICVLSILLKVVSDLIFLLFLFILVDLEVAQLVALLGVSHDAQPVTKIVFLQVFLGQILKVSVTMWDKHFFLN